jgi:PAS domain S-box-containing protein
MNAQNGHSHAGDVSDLDGNRSVQMEKGSPKTETGDGREFHSDSALVSAGNVVQSLAAAVYTCDTHGRILLFNEAAAELWGRRPVPGKDMWCGSFRMYRPDGTFLSPDQCPMAIALREGRSVEGQEIIVERPDGVRRNVMPYPEPLRDGNGVIVGAINILVDITEQKQLESARLETEGHLSQLLALMPAAVYACDAKGRFTYYNRLAAELWETEPVLNSDSHKFCAFHRISRSEGEFLPPDNTPMVQAVREGKSFRHLEAVVHRADGSQLVIDINIDPIRNASGAVYGAINVFQDISDRKKADAASRRLAAIVESSDDAIISKNLDGIITSWNAGAERIFGYTSEEAIGQPVTLFIPPERRDEEPDILKRIRRGERIDHFETVRQRKDGTLIDVSLTVSPIKDDVDRVIGASKIARDIGRLKRTEDELRIADQRKNHFLATLAHELRGPLAPLRNALQIMQLAGDDKTASAKAQLIMDRQLCQMNRLIDDLLDIGRITSGKLILKKERIDLRETIRNAMETCRPAIEQAGHQLVVELPPDPAFVNADPVRLAQVFSNLLNNAAKYTPSGGCIQIVTRPEENQIAISVIDNGTGIPRKMLSEIFELFMQVDRSLEKTTGGLGIGLTLAEQLVTMHGGSIEAQSEGAGKGSEFIVRMPLASGEARSSESSAKRGPDDSGARRRVLVVDDNMDSAQSLATMLKILGHETRVVHDGLAAVAAAAEFAPEIIVMDVGMPKLNGFEACRRIRAETRESKGPFIIALTGWGQEEDRFRCQEAGFNMHLVKPIEMHTLLNVLYKSR